MKATLQPGLKHRFTYTVPANKTVPHLDAIGEGRHERAIVAWDRFNARVAEKAAKMPAAVTHG